MKKLLLCAALVALYGTNAGALTIINVTDEPIDTEIRVDHVMQQQFVLDKYHSSRAIDISWYPAHTQRVEIEGMNIMSKACVLQIDAHHTLAKANTKKIQFAYDESGKDIICSVLIGQPPSSKPTKGRP